MYLFNCSAGIDWHHLTMLRSREKVSEESSYPFLHLTHFIPLAPEATSGSRVTGRYIQENAQIWFGQPNLRLDCPI